MPKLYHSHDYVPANGTLVTLVGFNADEKRLVPIGVGKIDNLTVISQGELHVTHLDYFGYAFQKTAKQAEMQRYLDGEITFQQMVNTLETPLAH